MEECCLCGALHGEYYRGDSYALVQPRMTTAKVPPESWRYYDFMVVGIRPGSGSGASSAGSTPKRG